MKAYTDITQSKKLAEILPPESADMEYLLEQWIDEKTGRHKEECYKIPVVKVDDDCPLQPITLDCWSLAALLDILPNGTRLLKSATDDTYHCDCPKGNIDKWYDNPMDACVEMIVKLKEKDLL